MSDIIKTIYNGKNEKKFNISVFVSAAGDLRKTISPENNSKGYISKTAANLSKGYVTPLCVNITEFVEILNNIEPNQALSLGTPYNQKTSEFLKNNEIKEVTLNHIAKENDDFSVIGRGKSFLFFKPVGGFLLIDIDDHYSLDELFRFVPSLQGKMCIVKQSSSSMIFDKDGNMLIGKKGLHVYFPVSNASDIPRIKDILWDEMWVNGGGEWKLSEGIIPALLERGIYDNSVLSPERLIYEAPVKLTGGLYKQHQKIQIIEGDILDTSLIQLDKNIKKKAEEIRASSKKAKMVEREEVKAERYVDYEKKELNRGLNASEIRRNYDNFSFNLLPDSHILEFQDGSKKMIANCGINEHGKYIKEPLEPEYNGGSNTQAKFFFEKGNKSIFSFAHGGIRYYIKETFKNYYLDSQYISKNDIIKMLGDETEVFINAPTGVGKNTCFSLIKNDNISDNDTLIFTPLNAIASQHDSEKIVDSALTKNQNNHFVYDKALLLIDELIKNKGSLNGNLVKYIIIDECHNLFMSDYRFQALQSMLNAIELIKNELPDVKIAYISGTIIQELFPIYRNMTFWKVNKPSEDIKYHHKFCSTVITSSQKHDLLLSEIPKLLENDKKVLILNNNKKENELLKEKLKSIEIHSINFDSDNTRIFDSIEQKCIAHNEILKIEIEKDGIKEKIAPSVIISTNILAEGVSFINKSWKNVECFTFDINPVASRQTAARFRKANNVTVNEFLTIDKEYEYENKERKEIIDKLKLRLFNQQADSKESLLGAFKSVLSDFFIQDDTLHFLNKNAMEVFSEYDENKGCDIYRVKQSDLIHLFKAKIDFENCYRFNEYKRSLVNYTLGYDKQTSYKLEGISISEELSANLKETTRLFKELVKEHESTIASLLLPSVRIFNGDDVNKDTFISFATKILNEQKFLSIYDENYVKDDLFLKRLITFGLDFFDNGDRSKEDLIEYLEFRKDGGNLKKYKIKKHIDNVEHGFPEWVKSNIDSQNGKIYSKDLAKELIIEMIGELSKDFGSVEGLFKSHKTNPRSLLFNYLKGEDAVLQVAANDSVVFKDKLKIISLLNHLSGGRFKNCKRNRKNDDYCFISVE